MESSYFWDAELVNGDPDREYGASAWAEIFGNFVREGFLPGVGDQYLVEAAGGMKLRVRTGASWVRGRYHSIADEPKIIDVQPASTYNRIDSVVIRCDFAARTIYVYAKPGAANGLPPTMQNNTAAYEVEIWRFRVGAGVFALTQADVSGGSRLNNWGAARGPQFATSAMPVTQAERDAIEVPSPGNLIYNVTAQRGEIYTQGVWRPFERPAIDTKMYQQNIARTNLGAGTHFIGPSGINDEVEYEGINSVIDVTLDATFSAASSSQGSLIFCRVEVSIDAGKTWPYTTIGKPAFLPPGQAVVDFTRRGVFKGVVPSGQAQMRALVQKSSGANFNIAVETYLTGKIEAR